MAHGHRLSGRCVRERETLRARERERERASPGAGTRDVNVSVFVCVCQSGGGGWGFLWFCWRRRGRMHKTAGVNKEPNYRGDARTITHQAAAPAWAAVV